MTSCPRGYAFAIQRVSTGVSAKEVEAQKENEDRLTVSKSKPLQSCFHSDKSVPRRTGRDRCEVRNSASHSVSRHCTSHYVKNCSGKEAS